MSRQVHLSIVGLERLNPDIWDFMAYPEGWTEEQKSDLLDNIRLECYELEVIYTDSIFMMNAIGRWSRKERPVWNALKKTMEYSYNPIENTDRYEEETITDENSKRIQGTDQMTKTGNQNDTGSATSGTSGSDQTATNTTRNVENSREESGSVTNGGNDVTTNEVQGYDSNAYAPHDKSTTNYGSTQNTTGEESGTTEETANGNTTYTYGQMRTDNTQEEKHFTENENGNRTQTETGEGTRGRVLHTHGNIGTMTVQQMIREEREIASFNLIDYIVDSFKQRFCILVY